MIIKRRKIEYTNATVKLSSIKVIKKRGKHDEKSLKALAEDIDAHSLLHPVILIRNTGADADTYEWILICGHRRLAALEILLWQEVQARIIDIDTSKMPREEIAFLEQQIHFSENEHRKNKTPFERDQEIVALKQTYQKLHPETARGKNKGESSQPAYSAYYAPIWGISRSKIDTGCRRIETTTDLVRQMYAEGLLRRSVVNQLLSLESDEQDELAPQLTNKPIAEAKQIIDTFKASKQESKQEQDEPAVTDPIPESTETGATEPDEQEASPESTETGATAPAESQVTGATKAPMQVKSKKPAITRPSMTRSKAVEKIGDRHRRVGDVHGVEVTYALPERLYDAITSLNIALALPKEAFDKDYVKRTLEHAEQLKPLLDAIVALLRPAPVPAEAPHLNGHVSDETQQADS